MSGSIVWIAAYPKSGSTWLRAVLTNYVRKSDAPASINELIGPILHSRHVFDEYLGLPSSDLTDEEVLRLRPLVNKQLAAEFPHPWFVTVHDAFVQTAAGPLFPPEATAGAVCLVRNPLDVAVSYAHHLQRPLDRTVELMNVRGARRSQSRRRIHPVFEDILPSWSEHVASWLESDLPVCVLRYEDMLADPAGAFGEAVRFTGLAWSRSRLARAIDHARFDRLRVQEERNGFAERQPEAPTFFRSGRAGDWRTALAPEHVEALVGAHAPVMERFGYLDEARAFLAAAERDDP